MMNTLFSLSFIFAATLIGFQSSANEISADSSLCNSKRSDLKLIRSDADWRFINDPRYRVFCVTPGNYLGVGRINLVQSGTAANPRYVLLDGIDADHPATMTEDERAVVAGLKIEGAWWTIDRLAIRGEAGVSVAISGSNNVLQRSLIEGGGGGAGQVNLGTGNDTVLQDNVLRNTNRKPDSDFHCIKAPKFTRNVRIIGNEIYNCGGDGLQIYRSAGMIIADNDFYITPEIYSDCDGNLDQSGECACAENAIDIKGTIDESDPEPGDWVRIVNNRFWGFRKTDENCGGTGSGGDAIIVHFLGAFVLIERNIIFNAAHGFNTPNRDSHNISVVGNIFFDIIGSAITGLWKSTNSEFYYNTIINSSQSIGSTSGRHEFMCNVFIDAGETKNDQPGDFNAYYNSEPAARMGRNDLQYNSSRNARNKALKITIKRLTEATAITIPNAMATEESPHFALCVEADVGQTVGLGVDDRCLIDSVIGSDPTWTDCIRP